VNEGFNKGEHGAGIGAKIGFEIKLTARQQNGDAVIADGSRKQNFVTDTHRARIDAHSGKRSADASRSDVDLVRFAVFDDLGVTGSDPDTCISRGFRHGSNFSFEERRRQPRFEHECDHQGFCPGARNREVVHRTVHRKFTDRTTRETQRLNHKAIGGDRNRRAIDVDVCGVSEWAGSRTKKQGSKKAFDEFAAGFAAGAVRHLNLGITEPHGCGFGKRGSLSAYATEFRLTIAALRCS